SLLAVASCCPSAPAQRVRCQPARLSSSPTRRLPRSTLFPYTTLFRSRVRSETRQPRRTDIRSGKTALAERSVAARKFHAGTIGRSPARLGIQSRNAAEDSAAGADPHRNAERSGTVGGILFRRHAADQKGGFRGGRPAQ